MMRRSRGLQFVILAPVLALMLVAGVALYFMVLRTVGAHVEENIRANLESLARSAFAIADAKVDRQNIEGLAGDPKATRRYKARTLKDFEDFAREHDIGLVVLADGVVNFATGIDSVVSDSLPSGLPEMGEHRLALAGQDYYARPIAFAPWNWRIVLVKDASAFEALAEDVKTAYAGTAILLLFVTLLLVFLLRQALVRPIFRIAEDFAAGRAPDYKGVREIEFLSDRIGGMMESLQEKSLHLETTFQSMSDGIAVFDADMRLVAWNPQYPRLYDYPPELIHAGASFADIMRYNVERGDYGEGDSEAMLAEIVERARRLDPPRFTIDRADGTSMEVRRAPMPDGGFVTTYTDITERRRAQEARIARREADAANQAKSDFLRNMSHDLRKPVLAIAEYLKLVLDKSAGQLPPRQRSNLENAQISADHLRRMIDEILEMSRIEAGQVELQPEPVSLELLLDGVLLALRPVVKAKGLSLSAETEDGLHAVTDPRLLSRIIMNLAGNAVEYTDEGKVTVTVRRDGDMLEVAVADTGKGIPANKLETIFEKFQQVEPLAGIVKPGMGLGLGLAISREFAHLLGGGISVASEQQKGSIFTLTIPLNHPAAMAATATQGVADR